MPVDALLSYAIYHNPADYPGLFVVRRWASSAKDGAPQLVADELPHAVVRTLIEARAAVPDGLVRFVRSPTDDPVLVETWL